jgi:hypothetical protein
LRVVLQVEEPLYGVDAATVEVWTPDTCSMCGFPFEKGGRYLVVAEPNEDGTLWTTRCHGTSPLRGAKQQLRYFRRLKQRGAGGVLAGVVTRLERDNPFENGKTKPLSGVRVSATRGGVVRWTMTDREGTFIWEDLAPGQYELRVSPGLGYGATGLSERATVGNVSCGTAELRPSKLATLHGRLCRPDGEGVASLTVHLIPLDYRDERDRRPALDRTSWDGGHFWFGDLPKGRYLVAVGASTAASRDTLEDVVFFPGVVARQDAKVITLGPATDVELGDFVVPAQFVTAARQESNH